MPREDVRGVSSVLTAVTVLRKETPVTTTDVVAPRRKGALLLLGAQWGRYVSQVLGIVILARLVGPADFGIVALGASVAGLAAVLGDFGLSMAALRAPSLTDQQQTNLFWINTGVGTAAAGIVAGIAPAMATAFDDARLIVVLLLLAPAFLLRSASAQLRVELNRSGRLGRLAGSELAGDVSGLIGAIVLAALGAAISPSRSRARCPPLSHWSSLSRAPPGAPDSPAAARTCAAC